MGEEITIFGEILLSFFAVVGFVYLCSEVAELFKYGRKRCCLNITISTYDYPYEMIFKILKAFAHILNGKAASFLFSEITILTRDDAESQSLEEYLGRYAGFAVIKKGTDEQQSNG